MTSNANRIRSPYTEKLRKEKNHENLVRTIKTGAFVVFAFFALQKGSGFIMNTPFIKVNSEKIYLGDKIDTVSEAVVNELDLIDKENNGETHYLDTTPKSDIYDQSESADESNRRINNKYMSNNGDEFTMNVFQSINKKRTTIEVIPSDNNFKNKN
ncbi:MAG: hypothetical protein WCH58_00870 [Candidatus Saccharibacteria bacterium]